MLAVFGPTATGKSALAHAVAVELGAEVIVADPFQRYRGLEIAADGPCAADRAQVRYHAVGDLDLADDSSAGTFAALAHAVIDQVVGSGGVPIVAGGTGLYVRAALTDMAMRPAPPAEVRQWAEALSTDTVAAMEELEARDPAAAAAIDGANPRRIARALERAAIGEPADGGGGIWSTPYRRPALVVGITRPREVIHGLIASRVRREIEEGLVAELGVALDRADLARGPGQVIGMREVAAMRSGGMDPSSLEEALNIRTRRLARMQDTWMRKMAPDVMIDLGDGPAVDGVAQVVAEWRRARGGVG